MAAVSGALILVGVAELAQLALVVLDAQEDGVGKILRARHGMGCVAGSAADLAIFQWQAWGNLHGFRWFYAGLVAMLEPDGAAGIADGTVVATQAGALLRNSRFRGLVHQ